MKIKNIILVLLIFFLVVEVSHAVAKDRPLKIMTYNILQGMRLDSTAGKSNFSAWVESINPDILALQEVSNFTQKALEELAIKYGHPYAVLLKEEGYKYPVALTSKYPIVNVQRVTDNMDRGFIMAEIDSFHVVVLHLSPFSFQQRNREIDLFLAAIEHQPDPGKWVIMGDFNALSPQDSANYADGSLQEAVEKNDKKYSFHANLVSGKLDYTIIRKVLDAGFHDALPPNANDDGALFSRPTKVNTPAAPSRIDFIFVSPDLKNWVTRGTIIKDDFTDRHSDHYPVLLELK